MNKLELKLRQLIRKINVGDSYLSPFVTISEGTLDKLRTLIETSFEDEGEKLVADESWTEVDMVEMIAINELDDQVTLDDFMSAMNCLLN